MIGIPIYDPMTGKSVADIEPGIYKNPPPVEYQIVKLGGVETLVQDCNALGADGWIVSFMTWSETTGLEVLVYRPKPERVQ